MPSQQFQGAVDRIVADTATMLRGGHPLIVISILRRWTNEQISDQDVLAWARRDGVITGDSPDEVADMRFALGIMLFDMSVAELDRPDVFGRGGVDHEF
jgi:hypothetical protein